MILLQFGGARENLCDTHAMVATCLGRQEVGKMKIKDSVE